MLTVNEFVELHKKLTSHEAASLLDKNFGNLRAVDVSLIVKWQFDMRDERWLYWDKVFMILVQPKYPSPAPNVSVDQQDR